MNDKQRNRYNNVKYSGWMYHKEKRDSGQTVLVLRKGKREMKILEDGTTYDMGKSEY